MPRSRASGAVKPASQWAGAYADASRQPLSILVFLLPLVVAYEIGLGLLLRSSEGVLTNKAHETLLRFFEEFGIAASGGLYLGGAAIIVVLLIWHLLTRDPWRIDPATPGLMAVESLLLSLPLIVLGVVVAGRFDGAGAAGGLGAAAPAGASSDLASLRQMAQSRRPARIIRAVGHSCVLSSCPQGVLPMRNNVSIALYSS